MNNFKILACFTRSYDKFHNSDNLHLIASTVLIRGYENFDRVKSENFKNNIKYSKNSRKCIIVEVSDNDKNTISENSLTVNETKANFHLRKFEDPSYGYITISFNNLLKLYSSNEKEEYIDYVREIFNYSSETKNKDQIYTQCLFIFSNITWSNIVLKFKINNIDISGGGTHTRHILTTPDIVLNNFLNMMFDHNIDYLLEQGFNTYKNEKIIMSSQLPLNTYKNYLLNITEIYNLKASESEDIFNKIKLLTKSENSSDDSFIKIIINNLLISRDIIIQTMILHYKNNLDNINSQLNKKNSEIDTISNNYDTFVRSTKHISNKEKKFLKKERTNLLKKGLNSEFLLKKIRKPKIEKSDLEQKLAVKKEELEKKIVNLKELSFGEIFQQYEGIRHKHDNSNYKIFKKYKEQEH
jgi:hypothetical protein